MTDVTVAKDAIRDCVYRGARAIDRCDAALFETVFWPDATHTAMGMTLPVETFVPMAVTSLRNYDCVSHQLGNMLIRVTGARAAAETYIFAYHRYQDGERKRDNVQAGRYLDRFENRGGVWKIIARTVITDWYREFDDSADWSIGPMGASVQMGARCPDDPSYALFADFD